VKQIIAALIVAGGFITFAPRADAQADRWAPWIGCWDMVSENVRSGQAGEPGRRTTPPAKQAPQVCVTSTGRNAVTMTTTVEGQQALEQTIVADGSEQTITDTNCRGTQRTEWSRNGLRLFATADLTCTEQPSRRVSGLSLIAADGTWLDIRTVRTGANETTRLTRYRRADGQPATPAPVKLTLDEVAEASARVSTRTLEAALVETKAGFDLSSRDLLELDRAGVPASVTDLLVALSYPERFVVERTARSEPSFGPLGGDPFFMPWSFGYPLFGGFYDDLYFPAYYYSPFAYSYLGRFNPGFAWGYYDILQGGELPGSVGPRPSGEGRVVDGQGYTRVRERGTDPRADGSNAGSSGGSASSSSGGGTVSTQGFSSGGSSGGSSSGSSGGGGGGDSGGRTAVPR
jgi:hypothetical protein